MRRQDSNNEEPTEEGWLWEKSESHCAPILEIQGKSRVPEDRRFLSLWVPGDAVSFGFKKMPVGHARYLSYFRYRTLVPKTERVTSFGYYAPHGEKVVPRDGLRIE
jgi:hypothetical protein